MTDGDGKLAGSDPPGEHDLHRDDVVAVNYELVKAELMAARVAQGTSDDERDRRWQKRKEEFLRGRAIIPRSRALRNRMVRGLSSTDPAASAEDGSGEVSLSQMARADSVAAIRREDEEMAEHVAAHPGKPLAAVAQVADGGDGDGGGDDGEDDDADGDDRGSKRSRSKIRRGRNLIEMSPMKPTTGADLPGELGGLRRRLLGLSELEFEVLMTNLGLMARADAEEQIDRITRMALDFESTAPAKPKTPASTSMIDADYRAMSTELTEAKTREAKLQSLIDELTQANSDLQAQLDVLAMADSTDGAASAEAAAEPAKPETSAAEVDVSAFDDDDELVDDDDDDGDIPEELLGGSEPPEPEMPEDLP